MVLKYHISPYPSLMEDMVVKIYEASNDAPGAEVYTEVLAQDGGGGHSTQHTVIANGLDKVVHIVRLYTADTLQLLHDYNAEPTLDTVTVFDPIRFKIGDGGTYTPIAGDNTFTHPDLVGLSENEYTIHRNNYGFLFNDVHVAEDPDTGSFALINDDVFGDEEEFLIQRASKINAGVINDSVVGKMFAGFVDVNFDQAYDPSHLRKLFRFAATATYEFEADAAIPIGYLFAFTHLGYGPPDSKGSVKFSNAPVQWNNTTKSQIDIGIFQQVAFVFDGALWNVVWLVNSQDFNVVPDTPNKILGSGLVPFGDVPSVTYREQVINHNLNIAGDYIVIISIFYTTATVSEDTKVIAVWQHNLANKANSFKVSCREISGGISQNISISYLILKA